MEQAKRRYHVYNIETEKICFTGSKEAAQAYLKKKYKEDEAEWEISFLGKEAVLGTVWENRLHYDPKLKGKYWEVMKVEDTSNLQGTVLLKSTKDEELEVEIRHLYADFLYEGISGCFWK